MRRTLFQLLALACAATLVCSEEIVPPSEDQGGAKDAAKPRRRGRIGHHRVNTNLSPAQPAPPYVVPANRGMPMCRVPGCSSCSLSDKSVCARCLVGFGLTAEGQCKECSKGCLKCATAGPGKCDAGQCNLGFTQEKETLECKPCAPHCHMCDEAGPGGCNECKDGRMLRVQREVNGEEVHECVSCGKGCKKCSMELGCTECARFFSPMEQGTACKLSGSHLVGMLAMVVAVLFCFFSVGSVLLGRYGSKADTWPFRYQEQEIPKYHQQ